MRKKIVILIIIDFVLFCSGIISLILKINLDKLANTNQSIQTNNSSQEDYNGNTSDSNPLLDNNQDSTPNTPVEPLPSIPDVPVVDPVVPSVDPVVPPVDPVVPPVDPVVPIPVTPDLATSITVNEKSVGTKIPSDFLGLSTSDEVITDGKLASSDASLINLLNNIGPGVFRFVGEYNYWLVYPDSSVCPPLSSSRVGYLLTNSNVYDLFTFIKLVNWKVIFGLNMRCYNPTRTAYEADVVSSLGGSYLTGFEIGNEPNGFLTETDYANKFNVYRNGIIARVPSAVIVGPATVNAPTFFNNFLSTDSTDIRFATYHLYPQAYATATIADMLSIGMATETATKIKAITDNANLYGKKVRYAEMNSVSGGGKVGVSDTFASALWSVDTMLTMAENGVIGVNIHGGGCGGYSAIGFCPTRVTDQSYRWQAFPLYYGLLFFHLAAQGKPTQVSFDSTINMGAHAILGDDGTLRVVLINRDSTKSVGVAINSQNTYSSAKIIRLLGSSLQETNISKITLAGNSVTSGGKWTSNTGETVTKSNSNNYSVIVPAGSAVLIILAK